MSRDPAVAEIETAISATLRRMSSRIRRLEFLARHLPVADRRTPFPASTIEPQAPRDSELRTASPFHR